MKNIFENQVTEKYWRDWEVHNTKKFEIYAITKKQASSIKPIIVVWCLPD